MSPKLLHPYSSVPTCINLCVNHFPQVFEPWNNFDTGYVPDRLLGACDQNKPCA